ncbi:SDR family NAD(P)-dependent oxidoreductase [Flagellimonas sp. S174]|uniref:SDR family NAD(P)-dependent oxidoreductase n=1 Tax=Flagellimonas sp. S174 TaxID=3410790 RepID=UPI003BF49079
MGKKSVSRRKMIKTAGLSFGALSLSGFSKTIPTLESNLINDGSMKGKVAFITGGARGIGLAIAKELAGQGVHCALYDIAENISSVRYDLATETDLKEAKKTIEGYGVKCLSFKGDVRNFESLQKAISSTIAELGGLHFVIANAGVTRNGNLASHTISDVKDLLEVNIAGIINTINATSQQLIDQKFGRIVSLSSIAGKRGYASFPVYGATKWAVIGLTKSMAAEMGQYGITSNSICPGFVDTALLRNEHMLSMFGDTDNMVNEQRFRGFAKSTNKLPLDFLQPAEIARMVSFLCSENANHITGETFVVDAGNTL